MGNCDFSYFYSDVFFDIFTGNMRSEGFYK